MCGIIGYLGYKDAYPILINGLKKLEYRGYDSSGIAVFDNNGYKLYKTKGKVSELEKKIISGSIIQGTTGIGHTRWATHGIPDDINAHPHVSNSKELVLIHNGIIENYHSLKVILLKHGFTFKSQTDTEVLVNLIEYIQKKNKLSLEEAVRISLNEIIGAYSIAIVERSHPERIVIAKLGSPLALGINDREFFIASDPIPFIDYTKNALYLKDGEMAILRKNKELDLRKILNNHKISPIIKELKINIKEIEKGKYKYFMLKEINEQPKTILDTLRGRLLITDGLIYIDSIESNKDIFLKAKGITIVACGTSWHASLIGEYLLEELARVPVEVEYASEFRYRNPIIKKKDIVIVISQSGETADTIAALELAKKKGAFVFGICNVVGSSIARNVDAGIYTHAGPEIGVASTKSFTAQITVLVLLALKIGKYRSTITDSRYNYLCKELGSIPDKVNSTLKIDDTIKRISKIYHGVNNFLYLGRGINFPVALEGALKLKEISYIHAEGYPAAEMKHGPIALIDESMPVVIIATKKGCYEKIIGNIQEIKARKGKVIAIVNEGDFQVSMLADHVIKIPNVSEELSPLLTVIPLQILAYQIAFILGENVDQPRNLAKSVTVE
ncbi:MAG: glutamine--fructose-6-phosphate transaminase (isomerizing) [Flavobacteriales bacterium]|jgi:glucosamine--fructose-6-phosphate aminotransferase (isomerizing)|uniref:glutamine--fructose-6-phosphate transaminase (isomerizing) n=1 Tax=Blattabacterium sp. (Mastotermes darwiniensis) TaxID=39768 RepID=UPI000231DE40|nr:glutamine--fructose-6-phosphate transaminase (isomerizing) [Blattabacterium sp. (Mastotermes darwiniensis)]AER40628.1 glucosamine--fructose-6-phosphate aminotransferase [Blattabacterium sp. (Mastotermes darwiniensis) str. MADAR]MDR1804739.1 glutamine--fructose-6-phosphate transaminase (isomerizing) [Flavobacteriales bacterium]